MNSGKICISICGRTVDEMLRKIERADEMADVIEIRFDCLSKEEFDCCNTGKSEAVLRRFYSHAHKSPYIATFRPKEQGGNRVVSAEERGSFWGSGPDDGWADLEADVFEGSLHRSWEGRICSHHDFSGVPADLSQIYARLKSTGADVVKIAACVDEATDALPLWHLLAQAAKSRDKFIPVAMGEAGKWTRILGLAHGAFLTYAAPESGSETAPGQISAGDLIDVFRVKELDRATGVCGIIAGDTSYSVSPYMHNAAFKARNINSVFVPLQVGNLGEFMRRMVRPETREIELNFRGFSVTNPHKQAVIRHLDHLDDAAKTIGAVNTIRIEGDKLHGYNTDTSGFIEPLRAKFGDLAGARVAVVGAGGAARACIYALKQERADVEILARDQSKAKTLAAEFHAKSGKLTTDNRQSTTVFPRFDIIVNATPLGTKGEYQNEAIAAADHLKGVKLVYDLVYNPSETGLMREARRAGVQTLGGLEMLIAQGTKQFEIWTGREAPVDEMKGSVKRRLKLSDFRGRPLAENR